MKTGYTKRPADAAGAYLISGDLSCGIMMTWMFGGSSGIFIIGGSVCFVWIIKIAMIMQDPWPLLLCFYPLHVDPMQIILGSFIRELQAGME